MNIQTLEVAGVYPALKAMRNPLDSWAKSDTKRYEYDAILLGQADKFLSQRLTKAGAEHCKHLRMVHVWVDMEVPRYIHSELDTYKFNTKISCSTMHTIHKRLLTRKDFQDEDISEEALDDLNFWIEDYSSKSPTLTKKEIKRKIKKKLPEGFLQLRTVDFNYSELLNIYYQRYNHQLPEWHTICDWILGLPHFIELTGVDVNA